MRSQFKYRTSFSNEIIASSDLGGGPKSISKASLDSLKSLMPEGINLEGNIDLMAVAFNAAVVNVFNRNHDGINTDIAKAVHNQFIHKPTNIEHKKQKVVGHIISSGFSSFGSNEIIKEESLGDNYDPFNIALSAVVYKTVNPEFAELIEKSTNSEDGMFNAISASWEIGFNDYLIAIGSKNLKEAEIVSEEKHKEELKHYLKAFEGEGLMDDGTEIYRLVAGDVYPLGIGFTTNPAANVKGLVQLEDKKKEEVVAQKEPEELEKFEINTEDFLKKIIKNKKIFSHRAKEDVISDKANFNLNVQTMETKELVEQLKETIKASTSDKFSEEAVANIVKVVSDAIRERSDNYVEERAEIEKEKEEAQAAREEADSKLKALEEQLTASQEKLSKIEAEQAEARKLQLFNDRMDSLDQEYDFSNEDRKILASELKDLKEEDEAFASYQEKIKVIYHHKSKAHTEEQEKLFNEKVLAEVEKRFASSEGATEADVEEVLESVKATEEVPSNNGASTEKEVSLSERFQQALSKESITIKY